MKHFLIVSYRGLRWSVQEFDDYRDAERNADKYGAGLRVCVFGCDSLENLKFSHASWFVGQQVEPGQERGDDDSQWYKSFQVARRGKK